MKMFTALMEDVEEAPTVQCYYTLWREGGRSNFEGSLERYVSRSTTGIKRRTVRP